MLMFLLKNAKVEIEVKAHSCIIKHNFAKTYLRNNTKYVIENIKSVQSYGNTKWDGTIYLVNTDGSFKTGYLQEFVSILTELGAIVTLTGEKSTLFNEAYGDKYGDFTLFPHQKEAVKTVLDSKVLGIPFVRGIINAATNTGKSLIMGAILSNYNGYALVLIHNQIVFKQLVKLFTDLGMNVGEISASKISFGKVTVAMERSFFSRYKTHGVLQQYVQKVGLVIADEAHKCASSNYQDLLYQCPALSRLAFSGTTLEGTQQQQELIKSAFGSVLIDITNAEMIEAGISSDVTVEIHKIEYGKWSKFDDYPTRVRSMFNNTQRLEIIKRVVSTYSRGILIVVDKSEHGKELQYWLNETFNVDFIHGELSMDARALMIRRFEDGEIDALISTSVLQEGVNIKGIRTVVYAAGGKSPIKIKQFIGRALRKKDEDNHVIVVDFYDNTTSLDEHSKERIEIYKKETFKIVEK